MNGTLVKKWMRENDLKAEQLAVTLNVSYPTVRSIMAGKRVHQHTVILLAQLMKINPEELLGPKTKKKKEKVIKSA